MTWIIALVILTGLALLIKSRPNANKSNVLSFHSYKEKGALLTAAELQFFNVLKKSVANNETIFAKVRQADILEVVHIKKDSHFWKSFNRISQKHVDFVLCDSETSQPLIIIELNDKSHYRQDRINRDIELREAIRNTKIKLVEIRVSSYYTIDAIKKSIYEQPLDCDVLKQNPNARKEIRVKPLSQPSRQQSIDKYTHDDKDKEQPQKQAEQMDPSTVKKPFASHLNFDPNSRYIPKS